MEKIAHFRFEDGNGSRKYDVAPVQSQLYIPQKFHQNRSTGVQAMSPGHIKKTPSKLNRVIEVANIGKWAM